MKVAGMRVRITFQKNETVVDEYGNHTNAWQDYFSCWASGVSSGLSSSEHEGAAYPLEDDRIDFTVRYSSETSVIDETHYRIMLNGKVYNINSISEMGFNRKERLFHTQLKER